MLAGQRGVSFKQAGESDLFAAQKAFFFALRALRAAICASSYRRVSFPPQSRLSVARTRDIVVFRTVLAYGLRRPFSGTRASASAALFKMRRWRMGDSIANV